MYRKLADKMSRAHRPTHELLSLIGIGPFFEKTRCENLIARIKAADLSALPINPGRGQTKDRERSIADRLAITYANITGEEPTRAVNWIDSQAYGRFVGLVKEVFEAAGIDASAEDCARHAVDTYPKLNGEKGS